MKENIEEVIPKKVITRERTTVRDLEMCLNVSVGLIKSAQQEDIESRLERARGSIRNRYANDTVAFGRDEVPTGSGKFWVVDYIKTDNLEMSVVATFFGSLMRGVAIQLSTDNTEPTTYTYSPRPGLGLHIEGEPSDKKIKMPRGLSGRPALKRVFESMAK